MEVSNNPRLNLQNNRVFRGYILVARIAINSQFSNSYQNSEPGIKNP
jgi:hypothetical protein